MKKLISFFASNLVFFAILIFFPSNAFADGTFTASNYNFDPTTNILSFTASNFSATPLNPSYNDVAIAQYNHSGNLVLDYFNASLTPGFSGLPSTTTNFNQVVTFNSFWHADLPTNGDPVRIRLSNNNAGNFVSQAIPANQLISPIPSPTPTVDPTPSFTASNVNFNPNTNILSFTASNFSTTPLNPSYNDVAIAQYNHSGNLVLDYFNASLTPGFSGLPSTTTNFNQVVTFNSFWHADLPTNGDPVRIRLSNNNAGNFVSQAIPANVFLGTAVPPSVDTTTIAPNPVQINTSLTATTTFTDSTVGATHIATINWGDSNHTADPCSVTEPNGSIPGSVSCTRSGGYSNPNVWPVTITVSNSSNGTLQATTPIAYASIYDATQSSIFSAGEHFDNPSTATPSTSGRVKFGLTYKYQGGTANSNRAFTMDFNTANIHFTASNVNSLVISNGMATLEGTGTITGQTGTYNFLVTGVNNGGIRILITDSSNNVIYDTQPGDPITATPITSVTGHVVVQ